MRQGRVVLAELVTEKEKRFLRLAIARYQAKSPVADLLPAGEPFVGPGEKNRPGQPAFHHALGVPPEHFGLLVLGMPDRVHPEFAEDQRAIFGKILEPEEVAL